MSGVLPIASFPPIATFSMSAARYAMTKSPDFLPMPEPGEPPTVTE